MHLNRKFVSDAEIKRGLSAAAFDEIEDQFAIRLDSQDRSTIRKYMGFVAGQLAWDDPAYVKRRGAAFESILKKVALIERLMDTKILVYRDRPIPWDDGERKCRKWVSEIREYLDFEVGPSKGSKTKALPSGKVISLKGSEATPLKKRKHAKPKDNRVRDLLAQMAHIYKRARGKGLRIWRRNDKVTGKKIRVSKFIDFVVAVCGQAGVEIPSHQAMCSIWGEYPRERLLEKKRLLEIRREEKRLREKERRLEKKKLDASRF